MVIGMHAAVITPSNARCDKMMNKAEFTAMNPEANKQPWITFIVLFLLPG